VSERLRCEFALVRYVPDPVKNEFVNIGVMLREAGRPDAVEVRFTRDWGRVRCVDPDADIAMLEAMEGEMRRRLSDPGAEGVPLIRTIEDSFSHLIQMTDAKACLAENMTAEMDDLMRLYVDPRRLKTRQALSGRQVIARKMRSRFEQVRVWDLMRKRIAASAYTQRGDPLKLDCGYRTNGTVKMFHAVSLVGDVELAKVLAFSAPALRKGVSSVEAASLELTAVVESLRNANGEVAMDEEDADQYEFGKRTMELNDIRVITVNALDGVAETARRELRV
jgi:hypothetical protein